MGMKTFIAFLAFIAVAMADVKSHATVKHGHGHDGYSHAVQHDSHQTYHPAPRYTYRPVPTYKPAPTYVPAPVYKPAPTYHQPSYKAPSYNEPAKYNFEWEVVDDYAKLNYGQNEGRDGYATSGEYRVLLPDCRTQVVKYNTADGYSGNVMEVTYEGTPCYEAYKPAPTYHAAPSYKPAPTYHA